ncbi:MAG: hypothetical protein GY940_02045 [bacterium]|nr:hypothetical protein [bacterium]
MSDTSNRKRAAATQVPTSVWRWDHHEPGSTFRALTTDGKKVVVAGDKGLIKTNSGVNWLKRKSGQSRNLYGGTYSKEKKLFVIVGYHGIIITSPTGVTWTEAVGFQQEALSLKAVAFGGGRFVAVGVKGIVKISGNGKNWRDGKNPPKSEMSGIHFHNGLFVATSTVQTIYTSPDGDKWTRHKLGSGNSNVYGVAYGKGTWVVGGANGFCYTSKDGKSWTPRDTGTTNYLMDIVYTGKEFIANGNSDGYPQWGSMILVSKNGISWEREKAPSGFNPGNVPCFSSLFANLHMGSRVYAVGTRAEIISKNINHHGGEEIEPPEEEGSGVTVTFPANGKTLAVGSTHDITWRAPGFQRHVKIELSTDKGRTWTSVDNDTKNDGIRAWKVPNKVSKNCKLRISDVAGPSFGVSSGVFTIGTTGGGGTGGKSITVLSPAKGKTLEVGSTHNITWRSLGIKEHVRIELSIDKGNTWMPLDNDTKNDGIRAWKVPDKPSRNCKLRITSVKRAAEGLSPGVFTIVKPGVEPGKPIISVISPNGGQILEAGTHRNITWESDGIKGNVNIEFSIDNGSTWLPVEQNTPNSGRLRWPVPDTPSNKCKIRISDVSGPTAGLSPGLFIIVEAEEEPGGEEGEGEGVDPGIITPLGGTNAISEAVKQLEQGGVVDLGTGEYIQTEPIVIPDGISTFSFLGKGIGATVIKFKNCNGLQLSNTRVHQCTITGITFMATGDDNQSTGILLTGASPADGGSPNILIRDVSFEGNGQNQTRCWNTAVELVDCHGLLLDNLHVVGTLERKSTGIRMLSCVDGVVSGVKLRHLDEAIGLTGAEDHRIEGPEKHGCENINFNACHISHVNKGITLGEKSLNIKLSHCTIDPAKQYALLERHWDGGGYHVIEGCCFGFSEDAQKFGHLVWLQNNGTTVSGIIADGRGTETNGLTLSAQQLNGTGPVKTIRVTGCNFKTFTTAIFLHMARSCVISGNTCEGTVNGIHLAKDSLRNKLVANTGPLTDLGRNNLVV